DGDLRPEPGAQLRLEPLASTRIEAEQGANVSDRIDYLLRHLHLGSPAMMPGRQFLTAASGRSIHPYWRDARTSIGLTRSAPTRRASLVPRAMAERVGFAWPDVG